MEKSGWHAVGLEMVTSLVQLDDSVAYFNHYLDPTKSPYPPN